MMIQLGLSVGSSAPGGAIPPAPQPASISINDFSRDRSLFDSGAALGLNLAGIPISGTGTTGQIVQARALSTDDGGASSTAWADIATISGGIWSGSLGVPRSASWYRMQVRIKAQPGVTAQTGNRFGVGHVVSYWGQSEDARMHDSFFDLTPAPALLHQDAVQFMYHNRVGAGQAGVVHVHLSDASPVTAAVAAMANAYLAARPGDKFAILAHAVSGTDPRDMVNDADPDRTWADDLALHDFATADGQQVGIAAWSWFAAPGSFGAYYEQGLFPLFTGKRMDGTPLSIPGQHSYGIGNVMQYDHSFAEIYDPAYTRWASYGPHRFDIAQDMLDATHIASDGSLDFGLLNKQLVRESWRAMLVNPHAGGIFLPLGVELLNYQNGVSNGAGGWTDLAHPSGDTPDGLQLRAALMAHAVMQAAGLVGWPAPQFDQCLWEPSGAWVEVWSSAGPVTTTRLARGEAALDNSFAHWTDVVGWQINGQPAERAEIMAGRVRIYPNGGGTFTYADGINYGEGAATGMLQMPEDFLNQLWKNIPIVDVGAPGVDGIALRALPDPAVLANTLAAPTSFHVSATGPYFRDPANIGSGVTGVTYEARLAFSPAGSGAYNLFEVRGLRFVFEARPSLGNIRIQAKDSAASVVLPQTDVVGVLAPYGVLKTYRIVLNHTLQHVMLLIDDVLVSTVSFTSAGNGIVDPNRQVQFFEGVGLAADVEYLKVWKQAMADGSVPPGPPYKAIAGDAAMVNSDLWKLGTDAT